MIESFCDWLSTTSVSNAFQSTTWFVPLVQTLHILTIGLLVVVVGQIAKASLPRKTGTGPGAAIVIAAKRVGWLLLVLLITGALLTITEPARELLNWAFRLKMIMVAILALLIFAAAAKAAHAGGVPIRGRVAAAVFGSILVALTLAIITAGRWIAYV
jgi:hypothetical protein